MPAAPTRCWLPWSAHDSGNTLSEAASKLLLSPYGLSTAPGTRRRRSPTLPVDGRRRVGYPVVAKLVGDSIAHKTERGLVRLGLGDRGAVEAAASKLLSAADR